MSKNPPILGWLRTYGIVGSKAKSVLAFNIAVAYFMFCEKEGLKSIFSSTLSDWNFCRKKYVILEEYKKKESGIPRRLSHFLLELQADRTKNLFQELF
jgi:hypothetical protein